MAELEEDQDDMQCPNCDEIFTYEDAEDRFCPWCDERLVECV